MEISVVPVVFSTTETAWSGMPSEGGIAALAGTAEPMSTTPAIADIAAMVNLLVRRRVVMVCTSHILIQICGSDAAGNLYLAPWNTVLRGLVTPNAQLIHTSSVHPSRAWTPSKILEGL